MVKLMSSTTDCTWKFTERKITLTALVFQLKSQSVKQMFSKPFLKEVSYLVHLCLKKEP